MMEMEGGETMLDRQRFLSLKFRHMITSFDGWRPVSRVLDCLSLNLNIVHIGYR
jgi:hypothetical protein